MTALHRALLDALSGASEDVARDTFLTRLAGHVEREEWEEFVRDIVDEREYMARRGEH